MIQTNQGKVGTRYPFNEESTSNRVHGGSGQNSPQSTSATADRSECLVRPCVLSDVADVTAIYSKFVETSTATFEITAPNMNEMLRRRQATLDHNLPYLVAELEGYIVGFCYASQFRPREGYRFTVEDSIYVRPDCIGHGVGKALLEELITQCTAKGCHSMVACICGVNIPSTALHSSLGFTRVGTMTEAGFKFNEWHDLTIMQRRML